MALPSIAVINFAQLTDQVAQDAIRAVNRQITEDFMPVWGSGRDLTLHAAAFDPAHPDTLSEETVRADGVLYLVDEASLPGALGYHDMNTAEAPVGFVFVLDPQGDEWTITLSHEALELIVDPTVNIFVPGPDPRDRSNQLLHSYEVCDAVETTFYDIDGIKVSNFVTPTYFREGDAPGTRNDFLGVGVASFDVIEGSHLGVVNLSTGQWEMIFGRGAAPQAVQEERRKEHHCDKGARPKDDRLLGILEACTKTSKRTSGGLQSLTGITRQSRYRAAGERILARR